MAESINRREALKRIAKCMAVTTFLPMVNMVSSAENMQSFAVHDADNKYADFYKSYVSYGRYVSYGYTYFDYQNYGSYCSLYSPYPSNGRTTNKYYNAYSSYTSYSSYHVSYSVYYW